MTEFVEGRKRISVAKILEKDDVRSTVKVKVKENGNVTTWSQDYIYTQDYYMGEEEVYEYEEKMLCTNCYNRPLIDSEQKLYCPVCS